MSDQTDPGTTEAEEGVEGVAPPLDSSLLPEESGSGGAGEGDGEDTGEDGDGDGEGEDGGTEQDDDGEAEATDS